MKLWMKFTLIFIVIFGAGLGIAGYICKQFLLENARADVMEQAKLMLATTLSTREYTAQRITPLIQGLSSKETAFHPETVPGFAATENFRYLQARFPDYSYKEATLNPTNLRDRAVDWEADIIRVFRDQPGKKQLSIERDTPTGESLVLARPIVATTACLRCHSVPSVAPASMIRAYGPSNGFGWKNGEIIGAQIISVPASLAMRMADQAFTRLMIWLVSLGVFMLVALNVAIYLMVVRPLGQLAYAAEVTSKGNTNVAELPVSGKDEISTLARAFNRMHRSLVHAMEMLEQQ